MLLHKRLRRSLQQSDGFSALDRRKRVWVSRGSLSLPTRFLRLRLEKTATRYDDDDDDDDNNNNNNNNNNFYLLQLGCYPVAVVMLHVNKTCNWLLLNLSREGYMRSM